MPRKRPKLARTKPASRPKQPDAIRKLTDSARSGELVAIIGTGASITLTDGAVQALSWRGLIRDGFSQGVLKGQITTDQERNWQTQLDSTDLDDLLGAAEFMGRELGAPEGDLYARWLENVFKPINRQSSRPGSFERRYSGCRKGKR
jgi:hypothetical protein